MVFLLMGLLRDWERSIHFRDLRVFSSVVARAAHRHRT